ncbi:MAG: ATP-grasp domain-containing protein [Parachlamydia sp.]|jgi:hypothetical protein|nr:ATP-grasp domain-containing protein [Parachlamydia sp.]
MANILITSGRSAAALELARQLNANGHTIFVAETMPFSICHFSNAVCKSYTVRSPRLAADAFIQDLIGIVQKEKIELIIPIYEEALYLAYSQHLFPSTCEVFTSSFGLMEELHNKWTFIQKLSHLGFEVPQTFLLNCLEDSQQLDAEKSYAVKAAFSRAGLQIKKLNPFEPLNLDIEPGQPWIAQEWLQGEMFCTYSVCRQGKVLAHATYPVGYTVKGRGCAVFTSVEHEGVLAWVEKLVEALQFTGQIAFDLVEQNKKILPLECNPRATSGVHLFQSCDRLDQAFFNQTPELVHARKGISRQLGIAMLLYGWKKNSIPHNSLSSYFRTLFGIRDVIYSHDDWLPLLMEPIIFAGICMESLKLRKNLSAFFMYDYEWNGLEALEKKGKEEGLCMI